MQTLYKKFVVIVAAQSCTAQSCITKAALLLNLFQSLKFLCRDAMQLHVVNT